MDLRAETYITAQENSVVKFTGSRSMKRECEIADLLSRFNTKTPKGLIMPYGVSVDTTQIVTTKL